MHCNSAGWALGRVPWAVEVPVLNLVNRFVLNACIGCRKALCQAIVTGHCSSVTVIYIAKKQGDCMGDCMMGFLGAGFTVFTAPTVIARSVWFA